MKTIKKIASLVLALAMVLAVSVSALAATTVTNQTPDHKYNVYQIFTGTQSTDTGTALADIEWGSGVTADGQTALQTKYGVSSAAALAEKLATGNPTGLEFAKEVSKYLSETSIAVAANATSVDVDPGYYLFKDTTEFGADAENTYVNLNLLQVTGHTLTIQKKNDVPSVEKKVKENSNKFDTDGGYGAGYNDVADYNIGDHVPFELIGTLPSELAKYDTYNYIFHDTLSAGLTYDANSVVVTVNGTTTVDSSKYTVEVTGQTLTIKFNNIKDVTTTVTDKIYVNYTATLNKDAVIGLLGNPNEVYLEYSNNPNGEGTGKTPTDKVIVFTYELDVTKVDGTDATKKLKDAEFVLKNAAGKYYQKDATTGVVTWVDTEANATVLKSNDNGLFEVKGLDDGTYYLKETKAPAGYNKLKDEITLVIKGYTVNGQKWDENPASALTKVTIKVGSGEEMGEGTTGKVDLEVKNNKGGTLPETGGIGTTIFYVVGTLLVLAAAILLITKRRMRES